MGIDSPPKARNFLESAPAPPLKFPFPARNPWPAAQRPAKSAGARGQRPAHLFNTSAALGLAAQLSVAFPSSSVFSTP